MARAIWKGTISFGLVSVPVALHVAVRDRRPRFRLLHAKDKSTVHYERVCDRDGKAVDWKDLVKGYEYSKGHFVVLTKEDFEAATVGRKQAIGIIDFVPKAEMDDRFFEKPYHLVPTGPGVHAYQVLKAAMEKTGLVAIATVVLRETPHLSCVHPVGDVLMLSMLRYADELVEPGELDVPAPEKLAGSEIDLAVRLIKELKTDWSPERYTDEYRKRLEQGIEQLVKKGHVKSMPAESAPPANVINLMERLQQSLAKAGHTAKAKTKRASATSRKPAVSPRKRKSARRSRRAA